MQLYKFQQKLQRMPKDRKKTQSEEAKQTPNQSQTW